METNIGNNLKSIRENIGLSVDKLATLINEKAYRIRDIERGKQKCPPEIIKKYIEYFQINSNWLFTGDGEIFLNKDKKELQHSEEIHSPAPQNLDINILTGVIEGVEQGCSLSGLHLDPDLKAKMISILYDHFVKTGEKPDINTCQQYLKLVS